MYNRNAIIELHNRNYNTVQIAIVMGCCEEVVSEVLKHNEEQYESTLDFLTLEQRQRLYVLDKLLLLRRKTKKFVNYDYCYITILKFLRIPREVLYDLYKNSPIRRVANAHRERSPLLQQFDYELLGANSEEWHLFVCACYKIIGDPAKWR